MSEDWEKEFDLFWENLTQDLEPNFPTKKDCARWGFFEGINLQKKETNRLRNVFESSYQDLEKKLDVARKALEFYANYWWDDERDRWHHASELDCDFEQFKKAKQVIEKLK